MYLYTEKELDLYEKYIEEQFGDYNEVFHEIVSPDIHLDIIIIPPTASNNYYKLITMGMGAYKMNVPKEFKQYELERAELVLYLPPTWNIKSNREEDYWPIRQLKVLARLPIQYDTWLGYGHTVSSDQENSFYASNTKFCSMMLLNALNKDYDQLDFKMETKGKINFYQLFPLYKEELDLKQNSDANTLLDLFDDEDIVPIVNIDRKNYAAKIKEEILN
ncbi:MAG: suppressor of fused domain protein [Thomasclavelia sp.]